MVKVLIVDDSAFMRKVISDFLTSHRSIEVVGTARNGEDAIKKIPVLQPDVITLDVEMPVMDGLEALEWIMNESPLPTVMLSSSTTEGAKSTFHALQLGAVDFVAKPSGPISLDLHKIQDELVEKVLHASQVNMKKMTPVQKRKTTQAELVEESQHIKTSQAQEWSPSHNKVIMIGTSTGGPKALQSVLSCIPSDIQSPIIVVQHMPPKFTESLAVRLNSLCELEVKEAKNGDKLENGVVYIAPGGYHLEIKRKGLSLILETNEEDPVNGVRPAVDRLFQSASELTDYYKIAVVMTGMGSDGTKGLKKLKESGQTKVIAESENTCIVYGMPKSAISAGVVDIVANVEDIPSTILSLL
ncbi:protein-glutamate O-methylesterase CheB [Bacillus carboniphilus]|uniref:Protein-glutamate methylesterase/protein-glutamine glutaminase n=1 Tax=Bacillus carboniphilus TaxID=86663 RepID=A0ABN0WBM2_9BACI